MRKIKSLVNQVRQFPEYLNAFDTLNALSESEKKYIESCEAAYGTEFVKFFSKQPKSLQPPLSQIKSTGLKQVESVKEMDQTLTNFKNDFADLNLINTEIQRKVAASKDAENTATKSQMAAVKTPSDLNRSKAEMDSKNAETIKNRTSGEVADLKKRFIFSLSDSLQKVVDARIKMANQLDEVSKLFSSAANEIKDFKDPAIPKLAQRMQQLDYEIAD